MLLVFIDTECRIKWVSSVPILFIFFYLGLIFSMGLYFYLKRVTSERALKYRGFIEISYVCYCIVATFLLASYAALSFSQQSFAGFVKYGHPSFGNLVGYNIYYLYKASIPLGIGYFIYYLISRKIPENYKKVAIIVALIAPTVIATLYAVVLCSVLFAPTFQPSEKAFLLSPKLFFM